MQEQMEEVMQYLTGEAMEFRVNSLLVHLKTESLDLRQYRTWLPQLTRKEPRPK